VRRLTKSAVREISGPADDTSRSLDSDRRWLEDTCSSCGTVAYLGEPPPGTLVVGEIRDVEATLPDGSAIMVTAPQTVESKVLAWECGACEAYNEADLGAVK
jgi:hypothetical protein